MVRGKTMEAPRCRTCGERHWSRTCPGTKPSHGTPRVETHEVKPPPPTPRRSMFKTVTKTVTETPAPPVTKTTPKVSVTPDLSVTPPPKISLTDPPKNKGGRPKVDHPRSAAERA